MDVKTAVKDKANYGEIAAWFGSREDLDVDGLILLADTAEEMSEEIYEYRRALGDMLAARLGKIRQACGGRGLAAVFPDPEARRRLAGVVQKAGRMGMILPEKYEGLWKAEGQPEGMACGVGTGQPEDPGGRGTLPCCRGEAAFSCACIFHTARCVTLEIRDGGIYYTRDICEIYVNGGLYGTTDKVVTSIYGLKPDTEYVVRVAVRGGKNLASASLMVRTDREFVTLDVRDFGAKGDGIRDDTEFIQAAIMACPAESRVLVPEGTYRVTSLFLKDNLRLELARGAVLSAETDRTKFPVFPGMAVSWDEEGEYNMGTWEGNPLPMFTAVITGMNVRHVTIYGEGAIDGNANDNPDNWWYNPKIKRIAYRPRMIFLNHCEDVTVQGIRVQNSPSWNIHPYFSNHLRFIGMQVQNPKDSPNTDGLDPESCRDVEVTGLSFSLGDDCIAVKSGKIYMGSKYKTPCEDVTVRQCCMRDGHGSVTIGSEMAGGVKNLTVKDCLFLHTDRGLRIKTRRGRGKDAVIDGILFENIRMDHVMTPLVVNCFYYCDPDGHTDYVQSKTPMPVDNRTPQVRQLTFRNIRAEHCHVAAAYFSGLPEKRIGRVELEHVHVTYAAEAQRGVPAMMDGIGPCSRMGVFAENVEELILRDVTVQGQEGDPFVLKGAGRVEKADCGE